MPTTPRMLGRKSSASALRPLGTFCNLHANALTHYESIGTEMTFAKGVQLFQEDERSRRVFVISAGQVKLSCTSKQGKTLLLRVALPGDVLGLGAVISGSSYEVTAETLTQTQVKSILRPDFLAFLHKHSEASLHVAEALSEEYQIAFFDARRLALSGSAGGRIASVLLKWGRAAADSGRSEMRFTMGLTHEDFGNLVGTSRETISRTLGRFRKEHLIQVRGSSILILSPKVLEKLSV